MPPSWKEKTVWVVTHVQTKPGKTAEYIDGLFGKWVASIEKLKKDGFVVSYRIFQVHNPRDNEPDVTLMIEYKNMAVFDHLGPEYFVAAWKERSLGEPERANPEHLRKLRGSILLRELEPL